MNRGHEPRKRPFKARDKMLSLTRRARDGNVAGSSELEPDQPHEQLSCSNVQSQGRPTLTIVPMSAERPFCVRYHATETRMLSHPCPEKPASTRVAPHGAYDTMGECPA